jgi:hypothetical protein
MMPLVVLDVVVGGIGSTLMMMEEGGLIGYVTTNNDTNSNSLNSIQLVRYLV